MVSRALVEPTGIELGQVQDERRGGFAFAAGKMAELGRECVVCEQGRVRHHSDDDATASCQGRTDRDNNINCE
jgi:hypothetical protein